MRTLVHEKKKKVVIFCSRSRLNVKLGTDFQVVSLLRVGSCCFANINLLLFPAFLPFSCAVAVANVPFVNGRCHFWPVIESVSTIKERKSQPWVKLGLELELFISYRPSKGPKNFSKYLRFLNCYINNRWPWPLVHFNENSTWATTSLFLIHFENVFFAFL